MTVIAWDGKTLATDRQFTSAGMRRTGQKLFKVRGGVAAICGSVDASLELLEWVRGARKPEEFPSACRGDVDCNVILLTKSAIMSYTNTPYPSVYKDQFMAFGSGRDYAMGAMHCGKSAREAVEIACVYESGCGMGIDVMKP